MTSEARKDVEQRKMSKWLKEDAVRLDLEPEEIIQALCEEIEALERDRAERELKIENAYHKGLEAAIGNIDKCPNCGIHAVTRHRDPIDDDIVPGEVTP